MRLKTHSESVKWQKRVGFKLALQFPVTDSDLIMIKYSMIAVACVCRPCRGCALGMSAPTKTGENVEKFCHKDITLHISQWIG